MPPTPAPPIESCFDSVQKQNNAMGRREQPGSSSAAATVTGKQQAEKGRDRRKERQRRGENEAGIEEAEGDASPPAAAGEQFFKVFLPEQSAERLKIPSPFQEYVKEGANRVVSLRGPSSHIWKVVLTSSSQGLAFTRGWKEFACDHSLVPGHFLVFTYDGHSEFSVAVFSLTGLRDKAALKVQPCKKPVVKQEEEEQAVEDVDVDVDVDETLDAAFNVPPVEANGRTTRKRARQRHDVMASDSTTRRRSTVQKNPEATADYRCMLDELSTSTKTRIRSKDVPRMGKFASRNFRQPVVISQRRRITEEEKNHALERANEFKSTNPFIVQVMKESYVYVGFFMNIPCDFVRESLPQTNKKMILWDPQGRSWNVNYVYYSARSVAAFSGGWGKFSVGNNLEKFDVCVFELFKEDNFKVHIYRVVPEITPLIRKSDM